MGKRIPTNVAKELFSNWTAVGGPGKAISRAGYRDTFESWFSLTELKEYIQYLEDNITPEQNPGVRVYFGSYGNQPGPQKGFSTIFLAPTREVSSEEVVQNSNDYNLDAYNSGGTKWPPVAY